MASVGLQVNLSPSYINGNDQSVHLGYKNEQITTNNNYNNDRRIQDNNQ